MQQIFDPIEIHDPLKVYGTISDQNGNVKPYKVYSAIVSQSGTDAPIPVVVENTTGATFVWTRSQAGVYVLTSDLHIFAYDKTALLCNLHTNSLLSGFTFVQFSHSTDHSFGIRALSYWINAGNLAVTYKDNELWDTYFEIRLYP